MMMRHQPQRIVSIYNTNGIVPLPPASLSGFRRAWGTNIADYELVSGKVNVLQPYYLSTANTIIVNSSSYRPTFTSTTFGNSRSGMTFAGAQWMYSNYASNPAGSFTRAVVIWPTSFPAYNDADGVIGSLTSGRYLIYGLLNGQRNSHLVVGDSGQSGFVIGRSNKLSHHLQPEVVLYTFNSTTGLCEIWQNGVRTGYGFQSGAGTETNYLILGDALSGGGAPVYPFNGTMGDVYEWNRVLTSREAKGVSKWLQNYYGINPSKTLVVNGHSNNTGYNIDGADAHNSTKSWLYKLMTSIGTADVQGYLCAIGGLTLSQCDTLATSGATTVGDIVFNQIGTDSLEYNTREVIHFFHGAENTLLADSVANTLTALQTYLSNRKATVKNTALYVIGAIPISSDSFATTKVAPFNDAIINNLSTYTALGMTGFIDPRNITNMDTFANWDANYDVGDDLHLNDAGTTALAAYVKTAAGL